MNSAKWEFSSLICCYRICVQVHLIIIRRKHKWRCKHLMCFHGTPWKYNQQTLDCGKFYRVMCFIQQKQQKWEKNREKGSEEKRYRLKESLKKVSKNHNLLTSELCFKQFFFNWQPGKYEHRMDSWSTKDLLIFKKW